MLGRGPQKPPSGKQKRNHKRIFEQEKKQADEFLLSITKQFINFVSSNARELTVINLGELFKEDAIAAEYLRLNSEWKHFCNKPRKTAKLHGGAFEEMAKANMSLTGVRIKPKVEPQYFCDADCPDINMGGPCCHPDHCVKKLIEQPKGNDTESGKIIT